MPINIGSGGSVSVSPSISVGGDAAGQVAYNGGYSSVSYDYGGNDGVYYDAGGGGGVSYGGSDYGGGYETGGTVYGQTYSPEGYAQQMDAIKEAQMAVNERSRQKRGLGLSSAGRQESGTPASPTSRAGSSEAANLGVRPFSQKQASNAQAQQKREEKKRQQQEANARKRMAEVPTVVIEDVNSSSSTTPATSEPTKSGKVVDTSAIASRPTQTIAAVKAKAKGTPGRPRGTKNVRPRGSRIAAAQRSIDRKAADGARTTYVSPSDLGANIDAMGSKNLAAARQNAQRLRENMALRESLDNWVDDTPLDVAWNNARQARVAEVKYAEDERDAMQRDNLVSKNLGGDEEWVVSQDLDHTDSEEEMLGDLTRYQQQRSQAEYERVAEALDNDSELVDQELEYRPWADDEANIQRRFAEARDLIKLRLLNPLLLRIESERVAKSEERHHGSTITKGRVTYSKEVNNAIGNIRTLYNCSIRDVLMLVQLRAGLGVDLDMKIGGKKASEFKLSDSQFVELCKDIEYSQREYGHPMAIAEGVPGGNRVRDDSGKFVVVAGTRCYPMGYVPAQLLRNISQEGSYLYGQSVGEIQRMINNEWLNKTYPTILANQKGNGMWQARALENMMRAVMSMDDVMAPSELDIPDIVINKTMMQMANEKMVTEPAVARAIEERERRQVVENERFKHRYLKSTGGRDENGNVLSPARKRFRSAGDLIRGVSSLEKGAKTADLFLWITNPIEAMQSMGEQRVGDWMLRNIVNSKLGSAAKDYQVTEKLSEVAAGDDAIEARSVLESLYRIGGFTAIDAFLGEMGEDGRHVYNLTQEDLHKFLRDTGVTGPSISERVRSMFGLKPGEERSFWFNVQNVLESSMLGSGLFKEQESRQFMSLCMMEMGRASLSNQESYTSAEVEQWASLGGAEVVRELIMTEAGREAFMTQGITSIGRKSPFDHAIRQVMSKNALTEALIRTCFDRFPEYGMNKIMRQIPLSNTLSYLTSYGITGLGSFMSAIGDSDAIVTGGVDAISGAGEALQRASDYQVGRRNRVGDTGGKQFLDGLMKNLIYDTVMAGNRLLIACVYYGVLKMFGGLYPPPNDDDEYNWSEWIIGNQQDGEYGLPIKWAWWMDDLSGVGLPLGAAFAVADHYGWSPEGRDIAAKVFQNAVANFNDGTALFDAIDLFKNFDSEMQEAMSNKASWIESSPTERRYTANVLSVWRFLGDLTPTVVKQMLPWSRDFIFRGSDNWDQRAASKVFDTPNYTMKDARDQYRVRDVDSYFDYMMRKEGQNNPVAAFIMNLIWGAGGNSDKTGYMFTDQPLRTETDPLSLRTWNMFKLDNPDRDPEVAKSQWHDLASSVCGYIDANFRDPTDALTKGFVINPETRMACQEFCNWMMYDEIGRLKNEALDDMRQKMGIYYLPDETYNNIVATYDNMFDHYKSLYDNYFSGSSDIPWRLPRYTILDSDYETRYVDSNGNAATYVDYLMGNAERQRYSYGNIPNILPFYSPEPTSGFANQSEPYWVRRDEQGNLLTDTGAIYDLTSGLSNGGYGPENPLNTLLFGGRGRESTPTLGKRGLRALDQSMPDGFKKYYDPEQVSKALGIDAFDKDKKKDDGDKSESQPGGKSYSGGGYSRGYSLGGGGGYSRGGGGGRSYASAAGSSSAYNPRIYNNPRQVYGTRAAGMSTRQPYKATNTYLRPNFYTKGSREAYKRSDI